MKFALTTLYPSKSKIDCLVIPILADTNLNQLVKTLDIACEGAITKVVDNGDLSGAIGHTVLIAKPTGLLAKRLLLVNIGKKRKMSLENFNTLITKMYVAIKNTPSKDASMLFSDIIVEKHDASWTLKQAILCLNNKAYQFDTYKSTKKKQVLEQISFYTTKEKLRECQKVLKTADALRSGINLTKDLGNTPCNIATPTYLAKQATALAKEHPSIKAKIMGEKDLKQLKMGALLAVGQGSREESHLIELQYSGSSAKKAPVVLVGKGVTFDTGGISLKPSASMEEMKFDMCGAATVLGVISAIAKMRLPINVVGLIPTVENMPDGLSYKPGDVITSMSGQTIEVDNTDAEGRLILCDALTYAKRFNPASIIDIATLTGAILVSLGSINTGLFSNNDKLTKQLLTAAKSSEDATWHMPLDSAYQKMMDSKIADMKNAGGRWAGSITAACFLSRFVEKEQTWAHLDVAGTAFAMNSAVGATGRPVPLLVKFLQQQCKR